MLQRGKRGTKKATRHWLQVPMPRPCYIPCSNESTSPLLRISTRRPSPNVCPTAAGYTLLVNADRQTHTCFQPYSFSLSSLARLLLHFYIPLCRQVRNPKPRVRNQMTSVTSAARAYAGCSRPRAPPFRLFTRDWPRGSRCSERYSRWTERGDVENRNQDWRSTRHGWVQVDSPANAIAI